MIHFWPFWLAVGTFIHIWAVALKPWREDEEMDQWSAARYIEVYLVLGLVGAWWWGSAVAALARWMP